MKITQITKAQITKISLLALLSSFVAFKSFAKTEGHYLGIDALNTKTSFYNEGVFTDGTITEYKPTESNDTYGLGLNYQYAINFDGFFVAPGVIIEQSSFGRNDAKTSNDNFARLQPKNRYGIKADFGYDINSNLFGREVSPYLTIGYALVKYDSKTETQDPDTRDYLYDSKSGHNASLFYGAGLKVKLTQNLALNLEYNYQAFDAKGDVPEVARSYLSKSKLVSRLDVIKAGIAYNF
jgi:outer membrane autotransporter protein